MNPLKLSLADITARLPSPNARTVLVGAVAFLFTKWLFGSKGPKKRMPPGPRGWPIVGSAMSFSGNKQLHIMLTEWSKIYGGIFTVRLGRTECVFLCSKDALRDVLIDHGDNTQHRPMHLPLFKAFGGGGITNNIGEDWKYQRRKAISAMRDFGMGKKTMEERIIEESQYLLKELEKAGDKPIDLKIPLFYASNNIICTIIFGNRFENDDPEFQEFMTALMIMMSSGGIQNVTMFFPELLVLLPFLMPFAMTTIKQVRKIRALVRRKIDTHRVTFDENHIQDFVDMYLSVEKSEDKKLSESMIKSIFDLFGAGGKTTATTLHWAILFLIHHPDIQDKCRKHIMEVIGSSRQPAQKDAAELPYIQAVIEETMRVGNTAPVAGFHCTQYELRYKDYIIPKDTLIYPSIYSMHLSEEEWEDPEVFRPERWIDDSGKIKSSNAFMPFGAGPRECPGQTLAKQEMFIFLTSMLQHFRFHPVDPNNLPTLVGDLGIVLCPKEYEVKVSKV